MGGVLNVFTSDKGIIGDRKRDAATGLVTFGRAGLAPLFALSSGMKQEVAKSTSFDWVEKEALRGQLKVTNNAGTGTTLTVADPSEVLPNTVLVSGSGEMMLATAISGNNLTVIRGFAGTSAAAINGSSTAVDVQILNQLFEENSAAPTALMGLGVKRDNYIQIFRNTWGLSRTADQSDYYTGNKHAETKREAENLHFRSIERQLWFGNKHEGTVTTPTGTKTYRMTRGVIPSLETNVEASGNGNLKASELNAFLEGVFSYKLDSAKENQRIAFCGQQVLTAVGTLAEINGQMNLSAGQRMYGLDIHEWVTPHGTIKLMTNPLFTESPLWRGHLAVLHPEAITLKYMAKTLHADATVPGTDGKSGVYTSELGLKLEVEKVHGVYTNIQKGVAED